MEAGRDTWLVLLSKGAQAKVWAQSPALQHPDQRKINRIWGWTGLCSRRQLSLGTPCEVGGNFHPRFYFRIFEEHSQSQLNPRVSGGSAEPSADRRNLAHPSPRAARASLPEHACHPRGTRTMSSVPLTASRHSPHRQELRSDSTQTRSTSHPVPAAGWPQEPPVTKQ